GLAVLRVFVDAAARALGFSGLAGMINGLKSFTGKTKKEMEEMALVWAFKVEIYKLIVLDFVTGLLSGLEKVWNGLMFFGSPVLNAIDWVVTGLIRMVGGFNDNANDAMTWGEKVGMVVGVMAAIIAVRLATMIPQFVIGTVVGFGQAVIGAGRAMWGLN